MKKILIATDFSERSDRAVRRGVLLARRFAASIALVHVIDDDQPRRIRDVEREAAMALLSEQAESLRKIDDVACEYHTVLGDPFDGITRSAETLDPDLVLLGSHRRQMLKDVFVGTTAERTIRSTRRPVLTANGVPAGPYRHVLIAVDFSDCSRAAARAVTTLRLAEASAVSVIHVFDAPAAGLMARGSVAVDRRRDYLADEEEQATGELQAFLHGLDLGAVDQQVRFNETFAADMICSVAREIAADLVVVGTRGRTGTTKLLLGSVAEEVLRLADRDVLAVPPRRSR